MTETDQVLADHMDEAKQLAAVALPVDVWRMVIAAVEYAEGNMTGSLRKMRRLAAGVSVIRRVLDRP